MKTGLRFAGMFVLALFAVGMAMSSPAAMAATNGAGADSASARPQGPCDIYAAAGAPCVAAHSTTRALYAGYNGPLYQVLRQSDGKKLDIGVVQPSAGDSGGYADAAAQDKFCANTYCWITTIYDQSPKHNDLTQAPRGGFNGGALGGYNNLPVADMAPLTVMGHKVYGVFIEPGMGLRNDDPRGTAVDDQAEGQYWVVNGHHFNNGCCFDYGNAETDSRDDDNGTMETAYFGNATPWFSGAGNGPWIMTDQENNLVGCVNTDGTKGCPNLPSLDWRFVTAIAKGEPHHWTSMGGDAQQGDLKVMFTGPRVNATYDPMRKQGAILLGNGGDNSNGSQGTFYEGAMTAAGTFPTDATDQLVHANVVAAKYEVAPVSVAPATAKNEPTGLQTFTPKSSQETTVTFENTTGAAAKDVMLSLSLPSSAWKATVVDTKQTSKTFDEVASGASVSATFTVTSGDDPFNGDLVGQAMWTNAASGNKQMEMQAEKVRNVSPVKINEYRISTGAPSNPTNSFIELYNAGKKSVDISNWTMTEHPAQQAIFSTVTIPARTRLKPGGFYLLALSNSGLVVPASAGDKTLHVRDVTDMKTGDTVTIGTGADAETRKIASVGTAATNHTTLWQPLPDGPMITIPAGSTNVPVTQDTGFKVGEKIALGYGAQFPSVGLGTEKYEVATVTAVGKQGTQSYLAANANIGDTNIKVLQVKHISVGDKIRLDIDSVGHGIETVTVTHVGTAGKKTHLAKEARVGDTNIKVSDVREFEVGDKLVIGTPANLNTVTITRVGTRGPNGTGFDITPALSAAHIASEEAIVPGTGLDIAEPLKFNHAANMPFSDRGTGISFTPATKFAHSSNEPVQALGTGITLDRALSKDQSIDAVVRDAAVKTAGYQGPAPNVWFGGPVFYRVDVAFESFPVTFRQGSMVLRDAKGLVVDSLNYGGMADPWAGEGYQGKSGTGAEGCFAPALGESTHYGPDAFAGTAANASAGRYPDGADTDSNCSDFVEQIAANLATASEAGATNVKVANVEGFHDGQQVLIDEGANSESATIATVGTAGGTTTHAATEAGTRDIPVVDAYGFRDGETVTIGSGADAETAVIRSVRRWGQLILEVKEPLAHAHAAGTEVAGSGITLTSPLKHAHAKGVQMSDHIPTPDSANEYAKRP